MPTVKLYPNGLTGGVAPRNPNKNPPKRGDCGGWSLASSRGNTRFLYSVRTEELTSADDGRELLGLAVSFTVKDCPETHQEWRDTREALIFRLRRKGLHRMHWLTEWQRRGVPHLHAAAWFECSAVASLAQKMGIVVQDSELASFLGALVASYWMQLTEGWRSRVQSQHVEVISDDLGWLKYLSKHAARGAAHYQRAMGFRPAGWDKTGRMWGNLGCWPTSEPLGLDLDDPGWYRFRRICRGWRLADARADRGPLGRRIRSARRMLQASDISLCRVRGVSEWIPLHVSLPIAHWLASLGHSVEAV